MYFVIRPAGEGRLRIYFSDRYFGVQFASRAQCDANVPGRDDPSYGSTLVHDWDDATVHFRHERGCGGEVRFRTTGHDPWCHQIANSHTDLLVRFHLHRRTTNTGIARPSQD